MKMEISLISGHHVIFNRRATPVENSVGGNTEYWVATPRCAEKNYKEKYMNCSVTLCEHTENLHPVEFEGLTLQLCPYHAIMSMSRGMDYVVFEMNEKQDNIDAGIDGDIDAEIEYERKFTNAMFGIRDGENMYEDHPDLVEREYI